MLWCFRGVLVVFWCFLFFFQAEDGIRDPVVTGVQTCALPIYERNMQRLHRKLEGAREVAPAPVLEGSGEARVGIVAYGSSHWAVLESRDQLLREHGLAADYLRVRAFPFAREVQDFVAAHERVYVVEQNRDGQMCQLLKLDLVEGLVARLRSVCHLHGLPLDARSVTDEIVEREPT